MSKKMKTTIGVSAALLTLAIAAVAFAHGGMYDGGYGRHMGGYGGPMMGYDGHMMGYGGPMMGNGPYHRGGDGYWGDLPEETRARIDAARESFYDETRKLRRDIEDANIDLDRELHKDDPDRGKVADLQKKLSGLEAKFDEKAVSHRLEMRKLLPEDYRGQDHHGRGYGYGSCWR